MSSDKSEPENPDFSLTLSDDLLAAAMDAVDKRFAKKTQDDDPVEIEFDEGTVDEDEIALDVDLSVDLDLDELADQDDEQDRDPAEDLLQLNAELLARLEAVETERDELAEQVEHRDAQVESLRGTASKLQEQVMRAKELNLKMSVRGNRLRDTQDRLKLRHDDAQAKIRALEDLVAQARTQVRVSEDGRERTRVRHARELDEVRAFGTEGFFKELLPVLDHLELAMSHADDTSPERMIEGVEMIFAQLGNTLRRLGLTTVAPEAGAAFDPNLHDAMKNEVDPDIPEGCIVAVLQPGYAIGARLIRAARVSVSGGREEPAVTASPEATEDTAAAPEAVTPAGEE